MAFYQILFSYIQLGSPFLQLFAQLKPINKALALARAHTHTSHTVRFHFSHDFSRSCLFSCCMVCSFVDLPFPFLFLFCARSFPFAVNSILMTCIWPKPYGRHDFDSAKRYFLRDEYTETNNEENERKKETHTHHLFMCQRVCAFRTAHRNMSFTSFIIFTSGIMTRSNFYFGNL